MITNKKVNDVVTHGMSAPSNFKIKASGKAFEILTSGLYTLRIHAPLRELGCNAIDAHVDAGIPERPFDVVLPTFIAPEFKIRDYGTGISEDDMNQVYTTLFESTKESTNDAIGCLGLGCKTPYAYTSSFIVKSFQDGIVKTYNMYLAEDGCPCYNKVGEKETDEENGLLVQFAVEPRDVHSFQSAARDIYKWFSVKPNVNVEIDLDLHFDPIFESENYFVSKDSGVQDGLIMGNIFYPLGKYRDEVVRQIRQLTDSVSQENEDLIKLKLIRDFLYRYKITGYVPIGTFDIAPSREEMSLDRMSFKNISHVLYDVILDCKDKWIKGLQDIFQDESYFRACWLFANYDDDMIRIFPDIEKECIHEKSGKELKTAIPIVNEKTEDMNIKCYVVNNKQHGKYTMGENFQGVINPRYFQGENAYQKFFFKKEETKSVVKRIRNYLLNVCHVNYESYSKLKAYLFEEKDVDFICSEFGIPKDLFHDVEELDAPSSCSGSYSNYTPKVGTVKGHNVRGDVIVIRGDSEENDCGIKEDVILEKDLPNVFYFNSIDFNRLSVLGIRLGLEFNPQGIHDLLGVDEDEDIYFIRLKTESSLNKVIKWDNHWIDLSGKLLKITEEWRDIFTHNLHVIDFENKFKKIVGSLPDYMMKFADGDPVNEISEIIKLNFVSSSMPAFLKNGIKQSHFSMNSYLGYNLSYTMGFDNQGEITKYDALIRTFDEEAHDILEIYFERHPDRLVALKECINKTVIDAYEAIHNLFKGIIDADIVNKIDSSVKSRSSLFEEDIECEDEENCDEENEENLLTECA